MSRQTLRNPLLSLRELLTEILSQRAYTSQALNLHFQLNILQCMNLAFLCNISHPVCNVLNIYERHRFVSLMADLMPHSSGSRFKRDTAWLMLSRPASEPTTMYENARLAQRLDSK